MTTDELRRELEELRVEYKRLERLELDVYQWVEWCDVPTKNKAGNVYSLEQRLEIMARRARDE